MTHTSSTCVALLVVGALACACTRARPEAHSSHETAPLEHREPGVLARAPMRNEVRVTLDAPIEKVWELVSDHSQLPSYSRGISGVSLRGDCEGAPGCVRTCTFLEGPPLDEEVVLNEPPHAYATRALEPNAYELSNDLTLVTLVALAESKTEYRWRQYYDHPQVNAMKPIFDEALIDIAQRLSARFALGRRRR